jgi:hypothetical protein
MKRSDEGSLVVMSPLSSVTNVTNYLSFDRRGFDQANVYVLVGTHDTQTAVFEGLRVAHHSSTTSASSMTAIAALSVSATSSASYAQTMPIGAVQGLGGCIAEFQIDLRGRERYIGLSFLVNSVQTAQIAAIAKLSRSKESSDTAAEKSLPLNLVDLTGVGTMLVVNG